MAIITDKKLLALALERKANPRHSQETTFRYKNYEYDYEKDIFPSARYQFPKYHLAYRDNQELAEAFTRDLYKKNSELIAEINKGAKTAEEQIFYKQPAAPAEGIPSDQTVPSEPTPPTEPSNLMGAVPSIPSGTHTPLVVHNIPHAEQAAAAETPQSKLVTASSSGAVREPGEPSKLVQTTRTGEVVEHGEPAQLVTADRTGAIKEVGEPSKLVTAGGRGIAEKPSSEILIANRSGNVIGKRVVKNLGSSTGIGIKKFGTRIGNGLGGILGGIAHGGFGFIGGTGSVFSRFSNPSGGRWVKTSSRRFLWLYLGLFLLMVGFTAIPTSDSGQPPGVVTGGSTLNYYISFRDKAVTVQDPEAVKNEVKQRWPNAQLQNWDAIVSQAIAEEWNPAFVLALWIEETGAQGEPIYDDALGCDPQKPTTDINVSLKCLFDSFNQYDNSRFADFMCMYSEGKSAPCTFEKNKFFPDNIKLWYSKLVPAGSYGALQQITPTNLVSCPVPNGVIKKPSFNASATTGHCASNSCPASSRRATAIDVDTRGENVLFPYIDGEKVSWYYVRQFPLTAADCEGYVADCGMFTIFQAQVGSTKWVLHLLHLDVRQELFDGSRPNESGKAAGKTSPGVYVHIEIGKNIQNVISPPEGNKDFDPGWIPADFMCS